MVKSREFRLLDDASLALLKKGPGLDLLQYCTSDPELSIFLRTGGLDIC